MKKFNFLQNRHPLCCKNWEKQHMFFNASWVTRYEGKGKNQRNEVKMTIETEKQSRNREEIMSIFSRGSCDSIRHFSWSVGLSVCPSPLCLECVFLYSVRSDWSETWWRPSGRSPLSSPLLIFLLLRLLLLLFLLKIKLFQSFDFRLSLIFLLMDLYI